METRYKGLTSSEAKELLKKYGGNTLPHKKPVGDLIILFEQIKSPLIYILIFAAIVSFILKDFKDAAVILAAVFLNTILGFYQERKAQKALFALKQFLTPLCKVVRDGNVVTVDARELVPGDLVLLSSGDRVPADGDVLEEAGLLVNEAVLTGESMPVTKDAKKGEQDKSKNMVVYMGTTVVAGRGKIIITKTGLYTEFGKIASELSMTAEEHTPLQQRISQIAKLLAILFAALSTSIFILGVIAGRTFIEMFTTSVAVAVAAIPEGMAVSLTAILALGMQRILKRKALVRKLIAAEALGSTTVIATDKTGTLTLGTMSVLRWEFTNQKEALKACILANNREDPLEIALWEFVQKKKLDPQKIHDSYKRIAELPFDSTRKYMAVAVEDNGDFLLCIKGAPDVLLKKTNLGQKEKEMWQNYIQQWGEEGLRLLAIGFKKTSAKISKSHIEKEIHGYSWLGLIGITDPVRESVKDALNSCKNAGIKLKVVTGDYEATSIAVLRKLGVGVTGAQIIEGDELEALSEEELAKRVKDIVLFSRVTPLQKLKIVNALQKNGEVVALVGDGVNDAPAIKAANIGIVVASATDVARQTADMVLLDSNFETIVAAVEEGRGIYQNIKKVIFYLLSGSFAEMVLVMGAIMLGLPLPLTASQILWINIVTDGFPNLALTFEPKEKNLLKEKPINPKSNLIDGTMRVLILLISGVTGVFLLVIFAVIFDTTQNLQLTRTIVFTALSLTSLLYVFSVRTLKRPIWKSNPFSNIWLNLAVVLGIIIQLIPIYNPLFEEFLETVPLSLYDWLLVILAPVVVVTIIEFIKAVVIEPTHKASF